MLLQGATDQLVPAGEELQFHDALQKKGNATELMGKARHDPCVVPRAGVIVEAMAALVLLDHAMRQAGQNRAFEFPAK